MMTNVEIAETIRSMMKTWDALSDEEREAALRQAADLAAA